MKNSAEQLWVLHYGIRFPRDIRKIITSYMDSYRERPMIIKTIEIYGYYTNTFSRAFRGIKNVRKKLDKMHECRISSYFNFGPRYKDPYNEKIFIHLR